MCATDDVGFVFVLSRRAVSCFLAPAERFDEIGRFDPFTERLFRVRTGKTVRMCVELRRRAVLGGNHRESIAVTGHKVSCRRGGKPRSEKAAQKKTTTQRTKHMPSQFQRID